MAAVVDQAMMVGLVGEEVYSMHTRETSSSGDGTV